MNPHFDFKRSARPELNGIFNDKVDLPPGVTLLPHRARTLPWLLLAVFLLLVSLSIVLASVMGYQLKMLAFGATTSSVFLMLIALGAYSRHRNWQKQQRENRWRRGLFVLPDSIVLYLGGQSFYEIPRHLVKELRLAYAVGARNSRILSLRLTYEKDNEIMVRYFTGLRLSENLQAELATLNEYLQQWQQGQSHFKSGVLAAL